MKPRKVLEDVKDVYRDFDEQKRKSALKVFLAGGTAGAISRTLVAPLTVIKSVYQHEDLPHAVSTSWKETAKSIYRAGGARMFWLGNVPGLVRIFPHAGVKFATYNAMYPYLTSDPSRSIYRARFVAGSVSGGLASLLLYPLDVLKNRVTLLRFSHLAQQRPVPPFALAAAARELWQSGGFTRATRGMGLSVVGSSLHNGMLFMSYHTVRSWWSNFAPSEDEIHHSHHQYNTMLAAATSGTSAAIFAQLTYPLDLIRRTALHRGMHAFDAAYALVQQGGMLGLYKGSVANLLKVIPLFAIQFLCFEAIIKKT